MSETRSRRVTRSKTTQADDTTPTPRRSSRARSNTREVSKPRQRRRSTKAVDDDDNDDDSNTQKQLETEGADTDDTTTTDVTASSDDVSTRTHSSPPPQPQSQPLAQPQPIPPAFTAPATSTLSTIVKWVVPVLAFAFILSVGTAGTIFLNAPQLRHLYQTYTQPALTADEILTRIRALPTMQHDERAWANHYTTLQEALISHFHQAWPPQQPLVIIIGHSGKHQGSVTGFVRDLATNIAYHVHSIRPTFAEMTLRTQLESTLSSSAPSIIHISNLEKMGIGALSVLQQYTDDSDAPYKHALFIISLTLPNNVSANNEQTCNDVIDQRLDAIWKSMDESKRRALKTRLRRHAICI